MTVVKWLYTEFNLIFSVKSINFLVIDFSDLVCLFLINNRALKEKIIVFLNNERYLELLKVN